MANIGAKCRNVEKYSSLVVYVVVLCLSVWKRYCFCYCYLSIHLLDPVTQLAVHPTGDQEVAGSIPAGLAAFFHGN